MPINTKDREYRPIDITQMEVREEHDGQKIVEGYATVFDQEYRLWGDDRFEVLESVDRRALEDADMEDVIFQYDHEGRVFARKSNGTLEVRTDERGLRIRAELGGTEIGRQLYEEIKGGYTTKMSFGFKVKKAERKEERDEETGKVTVHRKITEIKKLYDVSAVSLPANDATEISARNIGEGVIAEVKEEFLAVEARKRKKDQIAITAKSI